MGKSAANLMAAHMELRPGHARFAGREKIACFSLGIAGRRLRMLAGDTIRLAFSSHFAVCGAQFPRS